jgi:hypothetical protein
VAKQIRKYNFYFLFFIPIKLPPLEPAKGLDLLTILSFLLLFYLFSVILLSIQFIIYSTYPLAHTHKKRERKQWKFFTSTSSLLSSSFPLSFTNIDQNSSTLTFLLAVQASLILGRPLSSC